MSTTHNGTETDDASHRAGTVLVTGARGLIGRASVNRLERDGWRVRAFDLLDGDDLRDAAAVQRAASGCHAVVHAGAIPHDSKGTPEDIVATNVLGTWHVLAAAERECMDRVVVFSSIQAFGCSEGERAPDYLPIDDDHPVRAARPYGMSKRLVEEMCDAWTSRTAIPTVVLRPVRTVGDEHFARAHREPVELGGIVHVDDVAAAVSRALVVPLEGHVRLTLSTSADVDVIRAREVLGLEPARRRADRRAIRRLLRR
jgi:UDP-glucose 4-epimerase